MPASWNRCSNRLAGATWLLLAVLSVAPCRAGGWEDSLSTALDRGFSRLSVPAAELMLPGMAAGDYSAPGKRLAAMNLAAVSGEIGAEFERLAKVASAAEYLRLPAIASNSPLELPASLQPVVDSLDSYFPGIFQALSLLIRARRELEGAFRRLTPAERVELRSLAAGFEFWRDEWPDYPAKRMVELAQRVDRARIAAAGACLAKCVEAIRLSGVSATLREPVSCATLWGDVIIGSFGNDQYGRRAMLIVDPGGDDTFEFPPGDWPSVNVIVDLDGDDTYAAPAGAALGGSVCGAAWLEDVSGDDRYAAGQFSLGCGVLGVGVLADRAGNDSYEGTSLTQGAAFFGFGALLDLAGDDRYRATFGAQGACFASGEAVLADLAGDDRYFAGGVYRDYRSAGATKSFAQGCAAGIRPLADGGRAVLLDRAGADSMVISYLGQGAGYWGGQGMLIGGGGANVYLAESYAQGCGLHFAAGVLLESGGDDVYALEGVGQGAGEDRAWGILLEAGGNDSYRSVRMARGAGGAGGVGLLLEMAGDDAYPAAGQVTGGAGSRTWELPGIGLMFDLMGIDAYGDGFGNGGIAEKGAWGARLDLTPDN